MVIISRVCASRESKKQKHETRRREVDGADSGQKETKMKRLRSFVRYCKYFDANWMWKRVKRENRKADDVRSTAENRTVESFQTRKICSFMDFCS